MIVMFRGEIVEKGSSENVFKNPSNEYTKKLLEASEFTWLVGEQKHN